MLRGSVNEAKHQDEREENHTKHYLKSAPEHRVLATLRSYHLHSAKHQSCSPNLCQVFLEEDAKRSLIACQVQLHCRDEVPTEMEEIAKNG